jgi:hypothetical protein
MGDPTRSTLKFWLFLFSLPATCLGQAIDDGAGAIVTRSSPGYLRAGPKSVTLSQASQVSAVTPGTVLAFPANAATSRAALTAGNTHPATNIVTNRNGTSSPPQGNNDDNDSSGARSSPSGGTITGLDTVATFQGAFFHNGFFPFTMMGQHPLVGGTTIIPAKITEVSLTLLNANGTVNLNVPFAPFEELTLNSPNFEETNYRSGRNIEFADAIQRAEFFNTMDDSWHTVLHPRVVNRVNLTIPQFVNVQFPDGTIKAVRAYFVGTAPDGNHYVLLLDLLFAALSFDQAVNDIIDGNYVTKALNTAMFPNTFLFSIDNQGQLSQCCVLGFHNYFFDPGSDPQPRWIYVFANWISPGIFNGGFQDVTGLSHETSEAFNDPFGDNLVPVWQFPGVPPDARICQGNLETGDPIEVLPVATVPITIREGHQVFTYHPQSEALLQWFEMGSTSNAIDGAFSFPNEASLPHSALPCPP